VQTGAELETSMDKEDNNIEDVDEDDLIQINDGDDKNIIRCQFKKIVHTKGVWMLHLESGVMLMHGKELLFHDCKGDATL